MIAMKDIVIKTKAVIDFSDLDEVNDPDGDVESDMLMICGMIGHDDILFSLGWDNNSYTHLKKYLVDMYGNGIKDYSEFILHCD
jgi:hypothetical protein